MIRSKRSNQEGTPKSRKKWIKKVVCVLLITAILAINVPIPINIDTHAIEIIYSDASHIETRNVRIQGRFSFNVIRRWHGFRGAIEILEYPETHNELAFSPIRFYPMLSDGGLWGFRFEFLQYYIGPPERVPFTTVVAYPQVTFGAMYTTPFFRQALIMIADEDGGISSYESRIVVLHATTREEALEVILSSIIRITEP